MLLYGCEVRVCQEKHKSTVNAVGMRYLRNVWLSQCILKQHDKLLVEANSSNKPWLWRLPRLLHLNMCHMTTMINLGSRDSLAVPLRMLEVFTSWETCRRILGDSLAATHLTHTFTFLVHKGYFQQVRCLLDNKVPPLLEPSPTPPTPLASCLFDMITRPVNLVTSVTNTEFSDLILRSLCRHILAPQFTEPVQLFVIPALSALPQFPFRQLLLALRHVDIDVPHTTWLLFAMLSLEKKHFIIGESGNGGLLLGFLQLLASLTKNITKMNIGRAASSGSANNDSDDELEPKLENNAQTQVLEQCVEMLNDSGRVANLLLAVDQSQDPIVLQALCQVCHNLLVSHNHAIHKYRLLYMLAFKPTFLRHLWTAILSVCQTSIFGSETPLLHVISRGIPMCAELSDRIVPLLAVFCSLFSLLIVTLHDAEFYSDENLPGTSQHTMPFQLSELVSMTFTLKEVCLGLVELAFPDSRPSVTDGYRMAVHGRDSDSNPIENTQMWAHLFKVTVGLVRQLHGRDIRRAFCPEGHWISKQIMIPVGRPSEFIVRRSHLRNYRPFRGLRAFTREELDCQLHWLNSLSQGIILMFDWPAWNGEIRAQILVSSTKEEGPPLSTKEVRTMTILRELPFVVSFQERVLVFQGLILKDKMEHQGDHSHFMQGPSIQLSVRRSYLYEDSFDKLSPENEPDLRLKMRVQLVNVAGLDEAGVDGGGVFREFLSELLKTCFDPNRGFFRITKDNMLHPNPSVHLIADNFPRHYFFIGRILGKALYENLLVELPFADFFLSKLVGEHSDVDIHHLASLDPVIYRNLLFLKTYEGDVADLGLDFTVMNDELGETRVEELKPGGANIQVTNINRIEYIHLMADYKLNRQMRAQCNAFKQGLANVVPVEWLQMFNNRELQVLISGAQIPVAVEDLKQHTNYAGGYASDHPTIKVFWKVMNNFTDEQRSQLLKFVTSCSRPPLLGFKELDPPFCIQHAGSVDRLPTASTCMNLLKLPEFTDEVTLRDKLLYAIQAGAGFELS
uniref:Ubiquitin-protein ligase E3C n=1 Tax=Timema bartmani TaxID=61472 RepID=A0A7R9F3K7_9NEOP|nr:unnamed protein product [Timema bartmani]